MLERLLVAAAVVASAIIGPMALTTPSASAAHTPSTAIAAQAAATMAQDPVPGDEDDEDRAR
ncbi:hypothetical protein [Nonomuraea sp. NEAU-A123]|uniref:hypothetical protein n=1 Tax=Nonomuraea sp. NEAU-A123 TaxID=2839649 RepID=UPI001BE4722D|nr:hypothetical protein [Nonomuraea sp. NEAU-A123]MBT2225813.1 hypothetical protein [Nonomuraea sp. NEAU-A123]